MIDQKENKEFFAAPYICECNETETREITAGPYLIDVGRCEKCGARPIQISRGVFEDFIKNVTEKETNMEVFDDDGLLVKPKTGMGMAEIRDGLYYELLKLRTIETFIFYDSDEDQNALEGRGIKEGVSLLLKSIGFAMEAGLEGLDSAVRAEVLKAVQEDRRLRPGPANIPAHKEEPHQEEDAPAPTQ